MTYLPFLWMPDEYLFLKPEVTCDFAARVQHSFEWQYSPDLDLSVYEALLDMAECIRTAFADLRPRDQIDVQSLIWIVGAYREQG